MHTFLLGCIHSRSIFCGCIPSLFEPVETASTFGILQQRAPQTYSKHQHFLYGFCSQYPDMTSLALNRGDNKFL